MGNHLANIPEDIAQKLFISDVDELMSNIIDFENKALSDSVLMELIKQNENKDIRCWALLKLRYVLSASDAKFIVSRLLENDSRIRELSSEVIYKHFNEYGKDYYQVFNNEDYYNTYVETLTDINPRATRNITSSFEFMDNKELLIDLLLNAINEKEGPFVKYWALEGIGKIIKLVKKDKLNQLSDKMAVIFDDIIFINDPLLKEKIAYILINLADIIDYNKYPALKKKVIKLKNTDHFYIKQIARNIRIHEE